jgi:hypothetical protein
MSCREVDATSDKVSTSAAADDETCNRVRGVATPLRQQQQSGSRQQPSAPAEIVEGEEAEELSRFGFGLFQPEVVEAQAELTQGLAVLLWEETAAEPESTEKPEELSVLRLHARWSDVIQRSLWTILVVLAVLNVIMPFALLLAGSPAALAAPAPPAAAQHVAPPPMPQASASISAEAPEEEEELPSVTAAAPVAAGPAAETTASEASNPSNDTEAGSFNATAVVRELWSEGLLRLTRSNCHEAESFFATAIDVLDSNPGALDEERAALVSDRAFALVCATRYADATNEIETSWSNISATHVLNAAGYAYFKQKNYARAGAAFEAGLKADPFNKIMWSNLAAAKLQAGDLQAADDAMYYATDPSNTHFHSDAWFDRVFFTNVKVLVNHAMGQKADTPVVELWYDQISAR